MNNDVKHFISEIKQALPTFEKSDEAYFERIRSNIIKETKNMKDITYDDCVTKYGTPKSIVQTYIDSLETEIIIKKMDNKKTLKRNIMIIAGIIIILVSLVCVFKIHKLNQLHELTKQQQPLKTEINITEE